MLVFISFMEVFGLALISFLLVNLQDLSNSIQALPFMTELLIFLGISNNHSTFLFCISILIYSIATLIFSIFIFSRFRLGYWKKRYKLGHINRYSPFRRLKTRLLRDLSPKSWKRIRGCNLAVWLDDLRVVEGFSESFEGWGYEDTYGQICDPILDVPEGSNLCEEQEFFYEMEHKQS